MSKTQEAFSCIQHLSTLSSYLANLSRYGRTHAATKMAENIYLQSQTPDSFAIARIEYHNLSGLSCVYALIIGRGDIRYMMETKEALFFVPEWKLDKKDPRDIRSAVLENIFNFEIIKQEDGKII